MGRKVRENRYRDVLRGRLVTAILGDEPVIWISQEIERKELHKAIDLRIKPVGGTRDKNVEMTLHVKGDRVHFTDPLPGFPSQKLLTQLALVL